jgi:uncharacterized membrane protein
MTGANCGPVRDHGSESEYGEERLTANWKDVDKSFTSREDGPSQDNVESIRDLFSTQMEQMGGSQRALEAVALFVGRPRFLVLSALFVVGWMVINVVALFRDAQSFDSPPFPILELIISAAAFFLTTTVLIRQNRLGSLEERRASLELQINLLAEQKATKIIHLIEELRADLPAVRDRHDPQSEQLKRPTDPRRLLDAIDQARAEDRKAGPAVGPNEPGGAP